MNILIIGAGEVGFHLTRHLSAERHNITVLEADPEKARRAEEHLDAMVVLGSGASFRSLKEARIESAEILAALTNNDEVNLLACQFAKKLGISHTIARVRNLEYISDGFPLSHADLGVGRLIHPEKETADAIVRLIRQSSATDVVEFAGGSIVLLGIRLEGSSPLLGPPLREIWDKRGDLSARIVAIVRKTRTLIPRGEDHLSAGDQVFVICERDSVRRVVTLMGKQDVQIRNVMILGGGLVGQLVAQNLEGSIHTKLIERSAERSEKIAGTLKGTLVIRGDGTDMDLLALEGIIDMDAFIAATGDDETNIISTLVARHLQVPRTIALVNKTEYLPITPTIGLDAVVSKNLITVNAILRFIQRSTLENVAGIPGVQAQIMEFVAKNHSPITKKKLRNIAFPRFALVGAVRRGDDVFIPDGETQIRPDDRVVVFALSRAADDIERLF